MKSAKSISERKRLFLKIWGTWISRREEDYGSCIPKGLDDLWNGLFYVIPQLDCAENSGLSKAAESIWSPSMEFIEARRDCSDFVLHAVLRMLHLYSASPLLDETKLADLRRVVRGFVYWRDEQEFHPGHLLTENHQILFHAAQFLAGEWMPDEVFPSLGSNGREHARRGRERVLRWIDWRMRFGFSEWLSQHYLDENLVPLLNLEQFSQDAEVREKARVLLNLMVYEMAVNSFEGCYTTTQGRTYEDAILNPLLSVTSPVRYLLWGRGAVDQRLSMSAICLATSSYEPPGVMEKIALDTSPEIENRQRGSLTYQEALEFGLSPSEEDHYSLFVSLGYQFWPAFMKHSVKYLHPERWEGINVRTYLADPSLKKPVGGLPCDPFLYPRVNTSAFRTPDFFLGCANDWCKGHRGYQHHIWNALLPDRVSVFTNCPNDLPRTGRWAGNAYLPRAVAFRNVLLCIYRPPADAERSDDLGDEIESHAWFPTFLFDEVVEEAGWVIGRKSGGYVALRSLRPARWLEPEPAFLASLGYARPGRYDWSSSARNVWVCELGNAALHGNFERFVTSLTQSTFDGNTDACVFDSPSVGHMEFGWDLPLKINGAAVGPACDKRFQNPYCEAAFGSNHYEIRYPGEDPIILS